MKKTLLSGILLGIMVAAGAGAMAVLNTEQPEDPTAVTPPDALRERGAL